jgi:hypothetical protein
VEGEKVEREGVGVGEVVWIAVLREVGGYGYVSAGAPGV